MTWQAIEAALIRIATANDFVVVETKTGKLVEIGDDQISLTTLAKDLAKELAL